MKKTRSNNGGSLERLVRARNGKAMIETVPPWEAANLWSSAALMHLHKAMEWAMSGRRNRRSKILYYSESAREAMENAKREMKRPNDQAQRRRANDHEND